MDLVFSRTKKIPNKSFGRECSLCSSRHGVPIECSARGCKAAYHTTCAIRGKLKMQAIFGKNFKGGIKLRSYCKEHSPTVNLDDSSSSAQSDKFGAGGVEEIDMTNLADDRLQEGHEELDFFWKYVDINEVHKKISQAYSRTTKIRSEALLDEFFASELSPKSKKLTVTKTECMENKFKKTNNGTIERTNIHLDYINSMSEPDPLTIDLIYRYWMLLRTANNGQSLIKFSPSALKEREFEQRKSIMKLRIDLERVRNLSYMIGKREKLKACWLRTHQNIIKRTFNIINDLYPISDIRSIKDTSSSSDLTTRQSNQKDIHQTTNGKKSLHRTQHMQPTNGMINDQLVNDLLTCDQIY